jgi:hypothetical protein
MMRIVCFVNTEMDYLVMGSSVIERLAQPKQVRRVADLELD